MSTRTTSKQGRSTAKPTVKTPGKDGNKGEKQTATLLEIVPGRFNEADWTSLLENDDTEDFIADIFESIWLETSKKIEQIYIRRQLLPFTLTMIENALSNVLQVTETSFFAHHQLACSVSDSFSGHSCLEIHLNQQMEIFGWMIQVDDESHRSRTVQRTLFHLSEPIPCTMDNWGEGVVPACREENNQKYLLTWTSFLSFRLRFPFCSESKIQHCRYPSDDPFLQPTVLHLGHHDGSNGLRLAFLCTAQLKSLVPLRSLNLY